MKKDFKKHFYIEYKKIDYKNISENKNVLVGISYGVDSFTSKHLLIEEGYNVKEYHLDIENKEKNKFDKIIKYFVDSYTRGITPNICTYCNRHFKFYELNEIRKKENIDYYATGHYANVVKTKYSVNGKTYERFSIKKSENQNKDQSYMLYNLSQEELENLILPIGDMDKNEVRLIASKIDKSISEKKDSLDICFINDKSYKEYIKEYFLGKDYKEKIHLGTLDKNILNNYDFLKTGKIIIEDDKNKVLSYHDGIINYTIGQNIIIDNKKTDYYVKKINIFYENDILNNDIIVSNKNDLYNEELVIKNINFMAIVLDEDFDTIEGYIKTTYRQNETRCRCIYKDGYIKVVLEEKIIFAPGQAAVVYNEDGIILFGGEIVRD